MPSYYTARPSADVIVAGHQLVTREWWENQLKYYEPFVSELVFDEARRGDREAADRRCAVLADFPVILVTPDAIDLAELYLKRLPLPSTADADALHLALACINAMDYLLTWNCRHIARGSIIRALPEINAEVGYQTPTICTPEELLYENPREMD